MSDPTPTTPDPAAEPETPAPTDPPAAETPPADEPKLTQAEVDAIVAKRVAKAVNAAKADAEQAAERAKLDDLERAKAEKADAEQAAAAAVQRANDRLRLADAKAAALAAQVNPERLDAFLRTVDLSEVEVDEDGNVDAKALGKVIADGLAAIPEFKVAPAPPGSGGGDFAGGNPPTKAADLQSAVEKRLARAS